MLSMSNLARIFKVVALLLFVLPWVTISCAEQTFISMSGVDLATGSITMTNPVTGATERPPGAGKGDLLVVLGAVLIILSLAATFVLRGRSRALAAIGGAALAVASLAYAVLIRVPESARTGAATSGGDGTAPGMGQAQLAEMIRVNIEIGFWLTLAALVAAIILDFLALKQSDAPPTSAAPPPAG